MKLTYFAVALLTINLCLVGSVNFGFSVSPDETLYFQTYTTILGLEAMDKSLQNPVQQAIQGAANRGFISQPLAEDFMFQAVNITVYHETVPSDHGTFTMYATLYAHNASGDAYWISDQYGTQLAPGSQVDSIIANVTVQLLKGERISVYVGPINNGNDMALDMLWGNSSFPSSISYAGTAYYIPEFQSMLLFFAIIAEASCALAISKRLKSCKKGQIKRITRQPQD